MGIVCNPIFMHSLTYGGKDRVFGNDRGFVIGTIRLFLQQVEHGKALVLYTLMPSWGTDSRILLNLKRYYAMQQNHLTPSV
jgi:hypothetical protein